MERREKGGEAGCKQGSEKKRKKEWDKKKKIKRGESVQFSV